MMRSLTSLSPVRLALLVMGLVAVAALLFVLIWMTSLTNRMAREQSVALTRSLLDDQIDSLVEGAEYAAHWTHQFYSVTTGDDEAIDYQIGLMVQVDEIYDAIIITAADGTPLYAYFANGEGSDLAQVDLSLIELLRAELDGTLPDTRATISGLMPKDDAVMQVASTRIQLNFDDNLDGYTLEELGLSDTRIPLDRMPIAHFFEVMDEEAWADIGAFTRADGIRYAPHGTAPDPAQSSLPLTAMDGSDMGHVIWHAPRPGDAPLRQMMPVVAAVVVVMALISMLVGGWSTRQLSALAAARHSARTDHLTGLLNRAGLEEHAATAEFRAAIGQQEIAVLYLDLNNFKTLNDTEGHDAGDMALQITAERLRAAVRARDVVARLGGDEFACVLRDTSPRKAAQFVAARIAELTSSPIQVGPHSYTIQPSIGISIADRPLTWEVLVTEADTAMYHAKQQHRVDPMFYQPHMERRDGRPQNPSVVDLRIVS